MLSSVLQIPGIPGGPEVLLLLLLVVLLFGANKIPKLARSSGQAIGEFQKGREQVEQELEEMKEGGTKGSDEDEVATESDTDFETEPQVESETEPSFEDDTEK
ncbi:twin-arginine translocase TatA/TatE family subunit [Halapricum hydrolyticum]|uniref:Twin-arginine translocase TatA/TatE family subunit n=1 Tax=Halapricum hydrolyticum TaxID=2979991 RepID=A0AAE3IDX4_9EURY|nr:twin-arginine translocase TatA/TatE family subunit [Halapricum hydrolyticum]MCU4719324.1 twin-arginine translocase TatA/TatE family subunit [Halapricum hydrolyticum]MCU4728231.1 twin-arginine translocase TatA/TatE family subunit [Halapricum hydrolyticum]